MSLWLGMMLLASAGQVTAPSCEYEEVPADARVLEHASDHLCFSYAWPTPASAIPALDARLRRDAAREEAAAARRAQRSAWRSEAETGDPDSEPTHSYDLLWNASADTPPLLAMWAGVRTYTGGAHGGLIYRALYWDRAAGREIAFGDLFADRRAAYRILTRQFCPALLAMQVEKGHTPEDAMPCPALSEHPVALIAEGGRITALQALLRPYVAGSYVEGTYDVDLRLEPELLALVKPRYRSAFAQPQ